MTGHGGMASESAMVGNSAGCQPCQKLKGQIMVAIEFAIQLLPAAY